MNKGILLSVVVGAIVYLANGGVLTLSEVPENAWELLESGATYLKLDKDADEVLKTWDKDRLLKLLELRKNQGFDSDVKILESVIKNLNKKSIEK